jgi:hypothetical protein
MWVLMIQYTLRIIERFAILIPGLIIAYLSVRDIFPYFDNRLPLGLAILVTYALAAYVLIPAAIRVIRSVRPAKHSPLYCVTPDGFASDPLNIGVIGSRRQLILAMERAGWYTADTHSLLPLIRQILSTLLNHSYKTAPVSSLYLFGRVQDIAFELPVKGKVGGRHHVRFWSTTYNPRIPLSTASIHWQGAKQSRSLGDRTLWVGAASLDAGLMLIRHNFQISHMIDPDTDSEREFIVHQLRSAELIQTTRTITLGKAYRLVNRVWRGYLQTDGKMTIVQLK